jgi:hypothetical protein
VSVRKKVTIVKTYFFLTICSWRAHLVHRKYYKTNAEEKLQKKYVFVLREFYVRVARE